VRKNFGNLADLLIDAGDLPPGQPSTIVEADGAGWKMIREGAVTANEIAERIGQPPR
jgi:tRNA A37 threonylcarbamoyladenosine synthetase subunit TsaC/SUA5/YrdC